MCTLASHAVTIRVRTELECHGQQLKHYYMNISFCPYKACTSLSHTQCTDSTSLYDVVTLCDSDTAWQVVTVELPSAGDCGCVLGQTWSGVPVVTEVIEKDCPLKSGDRYGTETNI